MSGQPDDELMPDACGIPMSPEYNVEFLPAELYGVLPAKLYGILPAEYPNLAMPDEDIGSVSDSVAEPVSERY